MAEQALKSCTICGKPAVEKYRPFCSSRCADVDLGRWFGEHYRAPTDEQPGIEIPQNGEND